MSYFDAGVGKRPKAHAEVKESQADTHARPEGYFVARLGSAPRRSSSQIPSMVAPEHADAQPLAGSHVLTLTCPLCRGALAEWEGIYHCAGRCGARWLEDSPGRLVDLAALPLGICRCCRQPVPLVHGASGAVVCPASARAHVVLPSGEGVLLDALPHGVCPCCQPPMPLVPQADALVCLAHPERRYRREGQRLVPLPLAPGAGETLEVIDAALRRNSARLTINGLFDLD